MSPGPFYPASVLPSYPSHPSPPLPIPGCQHLLPAFPRPGFLTSCPTPLRFHHHPIFRDLLSHPGQGKGASQCLVFHSVLWSALLSLAFP